MKRFYFCAALISSALMSLWSCDDGDIYNNNTISQDGAVAKLTANISGMDTWATGYNIAFAGFDDDSEYAIISKIISYSDTDDDTEIVLSNIPSEVTTVELCILDKLHRRISTIYSVDANDDNDTIYVNAGNINASMLNIIQNDVFNTTCVHCHGGSGHAAGGLNLTDGNSYANLVGQASALVTGACRVAAGDSTSSVLHQALRTNLSSSWEYNHSQEITSSLILDMIDSWIQNGAKE